MSVELEDIVTEYIPKHLRGTDLYVKIQELMLYVVESSIEELKDVKYKYKDNTQLSSEGVKNTILEQGFSYIVDVMDTVEGLEFNVMLSFMDVVNQLKGTRAGLELVLKLMGFDSIIAEWWEDPSVERDKWSYEIIVIFNSSNVPNIFETVEKVKEFSDNYVLGKISNIDIRFSASKFASIPAVLSGFTHVTHFVRITERAY
jgi:hypothetical protein